MWEFSAKLYFSIKTPLFIKQLSETETPSAIIE
jgi:hypothetical protein